jgi:aryl-alcohol dehydrogenase-like predicted oxidoreductase
VKTRALGTTGLAVSIVGLGAGPLGDARLGDDEARRLVAHALDLGVTLFDTARSYGVSEERLGRLLGARRKDVVLATKGGYGADGAADWTPEAIRIGIEAALGRLRTDYLDVFFLHSCPLHTLVREDLLGELGRAKDAGKIRAAGYSGDADELGWAVSSGRFDVVECSVSVFDRDALDALARAGPAIGAVAKRSLANAPWRFEGPPDRHDVRVYWDRMRALGIEPSPLGWPELATRFSAHAPGVASALVGTSRGENLAAAVEAAGRGPLDGPTLARLDAAWAAHGAGWRGVV